MQNELIEKLVERAQRDDEFRDRLKADPRAAALEALGVELSGSLRITVVEEGTDEVILVLPAKAATAEIPDEELAGLAGGGWTMGSVRTAGSCHHC